MTVLIKTEQQFPFKAVYLENYRKYSNTSQKKLVL